MGGICNGGAQSPRDVSKEHLANPIYDSDDEPVDRECKQTELEDQDPILLTKIRSNSITYTHLRKNGSTQKFRASSLIDYMLTSNHFSDPETCVAFTNEQLAELDRIGAPLGRESVLAAKLRGGDEQAKQKQDAFSGVEQFAGEQVTEMLRVIETTRRSKAQKGEMHLVLHVFPRFRHYIQLMFDLNKEETMLVLQQYQVFINGPPNRPTVDKSQVLLQYCLDFIESTARELWAQ